MTLTIAEAFVAIRPKTDGFEQDAQKQIGTPLKNLAAGAASAFAAVRVKDLFTGFIDEAREAEKVSRLTEAALKSTGGAANITAPQIGNLAERLSNLAAVDDEVIQSGANVLLTFTQVRNEVGKGNDIFDQGVTSALNMSAALGTDLQGSIVLVGKALNDPIKGVTALQRAGVQLTEQQKEQVKAFVESGDVLSAQKIILQELETQFGGAAAAAADPAAKLSIAWGNLQEQMGTQLLPALNGVVGVLGTTIDLFGALPGPVQQGTIGLLALAAVSGPLLTVGGNLRTIVTATTAIPAVASRAATALSGMAVSAGPIGLVVTAIAAVGAVAASTAESLDTKLNRILDETATLAGEQLAERFKAGGSSLEAFELIASHNVGTAIRLRDTLAAQGENVTALNAIIDQHVTAQRNVESSSKAAAAAVAGETEALGEFPDAVSRGWQSLTKFNQEQEDFVNALDEGIDALLDSRTAYRNYGEAIDQLTIATRDGRKADETAIDFKDRLSASLDDVVRSMNPVLNGLIAEGTVTDDVAGRTSWLVTRLQELKGQYPQLAVEINQFIYTALQAAAKSGAIGYQIGVDFAANLQRGLVDGENRVVGSADSIAHHIEDTVNGRLNIPSPSAPSGIAERAGFAVGSGLSRGMEESKPEVQASADEIADIILGLAEDITSALDTIYGRGDAQEALKDAEDRIADLYGQRARLPGRMDTVRDRIARYEREMDTARRTNDPARFERAKADRAAAQEDLMALARSEAEIDAQLADAQRDKRDAEVRAISAEQNLSGTIVNSFGVPSFLADATAALGGDRAVQLLDAILAELKQEPRGQIVVNAQPGHEVHAAQSVALALRTG